MQQFSKIQHLIKGVRVSCVNRVWPECINFVSAQEAGAALWQHEAPASTAATVTPTRHRCLIETPRKIYLQPQTF